MNFKTITVTTVLLFLFFAVSCDTREINEDSLTIQLKQVDTDNTYFDDRNSQILLLSLTNLYPDFYAENLNSLKGIPQADSMLIATESFQLGNYNTTVLFQNRKKRSTQFLSDTLKMSLSNKNLHLNVLSIFKGNKQIIITDANNNRDFGDEKVFEFDKSFRTFKNNKPDVNDELTKIDTLPTITISQQFEHPNEIINLKRKVQIFPFSNYVYTQLLKNDSVKDLALMVRLKDYWEGEINYNSKIYNVGLQGINKDRTTIMIKPTLYDYSGNDYNFNKNFKYSINDTIQLAKHYFKIDSVSNDFSQLFLNKVILKKDYYGHKIGANIKDLKLQDLDGNTFKLMDDSKEFTLLDFWGTWCVPCKELTPELKRISHNYSEKLNIIGVASDKNAEIVKDYVSENNIQWRQSFSNRKKKSKIIKELKITSYPTFILIGKTGKVIYRGGSNSLSEIERLIKISQ